jgi:hypothetical protein
MQTIDKRPSTARMQNLKRILTHCAAVFLGFSALYTVFFSPVLLGNQLLAFADGIAYYLPAYYAPKSLWTDLIFGGYPVAADPQNMTWYPPALLLSWIPGSWNAFVILGYVLAGSFAYCYVYTLTASRLAGVVAGVTYSMSGFMMARLSMIGMIHPAAWIPLLICALENLRHRVERRWLIIGVIAVAGCVLAGHPQIAFYGLSLSFFYALFLGWHAPIGRWNYYRYALSLMILGIGICSIQLLPTIELSRLSVRAEMTQDDFLAGSLSFWQAFQYIFPFFFGHGLIGLPPYNQPYWGTEASPLDISTYVGVMPLILAAIGLSAVVNQRRGVRWFWLSVAIIAFLLIFGKYFPPATWMYFVPIYNIFRIPTRYSIVLALAVSILAGFGVSAMQQRQITPKTFRRMIAIVLLLLLGVLSLLAMFAHKFQGEALNRSRGVITHLSLWPWDNPAIGVPLVMILAGLVAITLLQRWPRSRYSLLILFLILNADLASYGFWFHNWFDSNVMPKAARLVPDSHAQAYRKILNQSHQRLLIGEGVFKPVNADGEQAPILPNLTRVLQIPLTNGYSPLMLSRIGEIMTMEFTGLLRQEALTNEDRSFDLMSTKYLLNPPSFPRMGFQAMVASAPVAGVSWSKSKFQLLLGQSIAGEQTAAKTVRIDLPKMADPTTGIALNTTLGSAIGIPNNTAVINVQVIDVAGKVENHTLLAGRDTAENAFDCPGVRSRMQHQRATVFQSFPVGSGDKACSIHSYQNSIQLDKPRIIKQLQLQVLPGLSGQLSVQRMTLLDDQHNTSLPLETVSEIDNKWRKVEFSGEGIMYENQQALPRTWLVSETIPLPPQQVLASIHTSRLPDGRTYEPTRMALVEDPAGQFQGTALQPTDRASVVEIADTLATIQTQANAPAFLVLSDVNYPGWRATIDGQPTPIFQTNYVQRGVKVPAGRHVVRFEFHPKSFMLGAGITAASFFGGGYWLFRQRLCHNRNK